MSVERDIAGEIAALRAMLHELLTSSRVRACATPSARGWLMSVVNALDSARELLLWEADAREADERKETSNG